MSRPQYWVGVKKGVWTGHDVFEAEPESITPAAYPDYDYVLGPYDDKELAEDRAKTETNGTGMFHAFPGHPR